MDDRYPRQGEVYLVKALRFIGDTKKRPAIVVSVDIRNQYKNTVLVVPFTSNISGGESPTRPLISKGEGGLECDSLAVCDNVSAIRKIYLDGDAYGRVSSRTLERIQRGIQIAIGVWGEQL